MKHNEWFNDQWGSDSLTHSKIFTEPLDLAGIAALGSCFARNITRGLFHYNISKSFKNWEILYNVFAIEYEIRRTFSSVDWKKYMILEGDSDSKQILYRDPWRSWITGNAIEEIERKNLEADILSKNAFQDTQCILMTLGVSEIWEHVVDGSKAILNRAPVGADVSEIGSRWQHRFADVHETETSIQNIISLIRFYISRDVPIIFTLSPIPIKQTSSGLCIREANNIVKSILNIAIQNCINPLEGVYYFASYEMVQEISETDSSIWQPDRRHLSASLVDRIARRFLQQSGYEHELNHQHSKNTFSVPFHEIDGRIIGKQLVSGQIELLEYNKES